MTSPLRADAARNREQVLAVAREHLTARGDTPPMKDLARLAGVGVGTVYRHFPTHQVLLEALGVDGMRKLVRATRDAAADPDPEAGFARVMEYVLRGQLADPGIAAVVSGEGACAEALPLAAELGEAVSALLVRARAAGIVRRDLDPGDIRRLLSGMASAVGVPPDESRLRRYLTVFLDGLRPPRR
ncbi:MAG: TetR/AcrR family transcriptional regulator [Streptosporangiaceae bacterium]